MDGDNPLFRILAERYILPSGNWKSNLKSNRLNRYESYERHNFGAPLELFVENSRAEGII